MNISPTSSSHSSPTTSTPSSPKGEFSHLFESLALSPAPTFHSMPSVPPFPQVHLGHYSATISSQAKGKEPATSSRQEPPTRLNRTPLTQALAQELSRFGCRNNPERLIVSALAHKDSKPQLASLPDDEFLALHFYTHNFYKAVNRQLRSDQVSEDMQLIVDNMQKGLKRLAQDPKNVAVGTLYRGINKPVTDDFIHQNFRLGDTYRDKTFISASEDRFISASGYTFTKSTESGSQRSPLLEIESSSAVRLAALSNMEGEEEALFGLEAQFQVTGKELDRFGGWRIKLKEI
ncbi:ADP-ribosyltransferase domain-containing protein [Pseudomonas indica]|uniref:ADP-ribosyltransferase domain-containing protein n=1 Tax=Pseudomonas indica TaxID=137658 RepID=UPI0020D0AD6E|nr:ADP-ribosyltransferase domain-containing protein [Pseudomonas indica]